MDAIKWKPENWVSLLLAVLVGPFAFLYANSAKLFWCFTIILVVAIGAYYYGLIAMPVFQFFSPVLCFIGVLAFLVIREKPAAYRQWYSKWWWALFILLVVLSTLFRVFFYEFFLIPSSSMSPSLSIGDRIVVHKRGYGSYSAYGVMIKESLPSDSLQLERGRVYAFKKQGSDAIYVKRLIGLPGDQVEIIGSKLYLNSQAVAKSEVSSNSSEAIYEEKLDKISYKIKVMNTLSRNRNYSFNVPDGQYFLLGDNRDNSADSRHFGAISKDRFFGHVVHVIK